MWHVQWSIVLIVPIIFDLCQDWLWSESTYIGRIMEQTLHQLVRHTPNRLLNKFLFKHSQLYLHQGQHVYQQTVPFCSLQAAKDYSQWTSMAIQEGTTKSLPIWVPPVTFSHIKMTLFLWPKINRYLSWTCLRWPFKDQKFNKTFGKWPYSASSLMEIRQSPSLWQPKSSKMYWQFLLVLEFSKLCLFCFLY